MTNLTTTEIKAIIEEKGSNIIETFVEVRNDIFRNDQRTQSKIISTELFGVENATIRYFVYSGYTSTQKVVIQVRVEVTADLLNYLSAKEGISLSDSVEIDFSIEPEVVSTALTFEELSEYASSNRNRFIVAIPRHALGFDQEKKKRLILDLLSSSVPFSDIHFFVLPQVMSANDMVNVEVIVSDLQSGLEAYRDEMKIREIYSALETENCVRHTQQLTEADLRVARENNSSFDEGYVFSRLMEVSYEGLLEEGGYSVKIQVSNEFADFCHVDQYEQKAVGFNPITNKIIVKVDGYISYEFLEA